MTRKTFDVVKDTTRRDFNYLVELGILRKIGKGWGDTVLDPFCGTGTTMLVAMRCHRNSIGIEIDREYCRMAANSLQKETQDFFSNCRLEFKKQISTQAHGLILHEERSLYQVRRRKA